MSVIVKGLDMPKSCIECGLQFGGFCFAKPADVEDEKVAENPIEAASQKYPKWCPMVELPGKHGRLIDADAFIKHLEKEFADGYENDKKSDADMKMLIAKMHELIITEIHKRPTVIESEE